MMWKWGVVLVMLCAWEACSAEGQVNLVEPLISEWAPKPYPHTTKYWQLFDYDKSTYQIVRRGGYAGGVEYSLPRAYSIRPTKYRIIMAAHVLSAHYPSSWQVTVENDNDHYDINVSGAVFKNGVYEGTFTKQIDMTRIFIKFDQKQVDVAEVELLGPQSALDALWPYGDYPCSQRLAVITRKSGPKRIFSQSKNYVSQENLRNVFSKKESYQEFEFDGANPVIIGAKLPSLPKVLEISVDASDLIGDSVKEVVLEANMCENGHCPSFGSKGWVKLWAGNQLKADEADYWAVNGPRIFLKNPGEYQAYRLKFIPKIDHPTKPDGVSFAVYGIYFLGCTA